MEDEQTAETKANALLAKAQIQDIRDNGIADPTHEPYRSETLDARGNPAPGGKLFGGDGAGGTIALVVFVAAILGLNCVWARAAANSTFQPNPVIDSSVFVVSATILAYTYVYNRTQSLKRALNASILLIGLGGVSARFGYLLFDQGWPGLLIGLAIIGLAGVVSMGPART